MSDLELEYRKVRAGLYPHKMEVMQQMEPFVAKHLNMLKTVEDSWQPQDFLPDMSSEDWADQVKALREECTELPDELLVAIVGDTVTEEALPTYQTLLNTFEGMDDPTGISLNPWAQWSRGWTAEENRHGDLLNKYLYLSGKIDMRSMEVTVHELIRNGFNPGTNKDPYRGIVYTSFQERATKFSHQNVARLCSQSGAKTLGILTTRIAGDEARYAGSRADSPWQSRARVRRCVGPHSKDEARSRVGPMRHGGWLTCTPAHLLPPPFHALGLAPSPGTRKPTRHS